MQAASLKGEVVQQVVHNGDTLERLRQQPRVAEVHDRCSGKYIAGLDLGVQQACFHRAPHPCEVILRIAGAVVGKQVDAAAHTGAPRTGVELETEHGEGVDTDPHRALSISGLEEGH